MAVIYERIVQEDLNIGVGNVEVTMPGGGTQTGTRISTISFPHVGFAAHLSVPVAVVPGSVIAPDVKEWDIGSWYNPSNGRFAPTIPGHYHVEGYVELLSLSGTARLSIFQGGVHLQSVEAVRSGTPARWTVSALVYLNGADYVDLRLDAGNTTVNAARFTGFTVGSVARP